MPDTLVEWGAWGAIATATFTGASFVIAWLVYRQSKVDTGRAPALRLSAMKDAPELESVRQGWKAEDFASFHATREIAFYVYNRSGVPQTVMIRGLRVRWPRRSPWKLLDDGISFVVLPHHGGNGYLRRLNFDWISLTPEEAALAARSALGNRLLVEIRMFAVDGRQYSRTRWVTLFSR